MKNIIAVVVGLVVSYLLGIYLEPFMARSIGAYGGKIGFYLAMFLSGAVTGMIASGRPWLWAGIVGLIQVIHMGLIWFQISNRHAGISMSYSNPKTMMLLTGILIVTALGGLVGGKIRK